MLVFYRFLGNTAQLIPDQAKEEKADKILRLCVNMFHMKAIISYSQEKSREK